ncbi:MAG: glutathione S-transferase family protein [Methyloligellaceae bacterium]
MITLYTFGPMFGIPDPSSFCMKGQVLLKMADLDFQTATADLRKAPKKKAPYLEDQGNIIADSTFIRKYLEQSYNIDFDPGLSLAEKGVAWAFEKLCEDNLYWAVVHSRWMVDENFEIGPSHFFNAIPAVVRPGIRAMVRRQVRRDLKGQGMGRHTSGEIDELATDGLNSIAAFLADKPYLMGGQPCGADASVFSLLTGLMCDWFQTPMRESALEHENLVAYRDRLMVRYFPDFAPTSDQD